MKTKLTHSSLSTFRRCGRMYYYKYVLGLRRDVEAGPLRFGKAFHNGLEIYANTGDADKALAEATAGYAAPPPGDIPAEKWAIEFQTVWCLLAGHFWRYGEDRLKIVQSEVAFEVPLINPETGRTSRRYSLAGKIDNLCELPVHTSDEAPTLAVGEFKTSGADISDASSYWLRLRCDPQVSIYVLAAREITGRRIDTVIYDVTRKPTIRQRQKETPEEYGQRLWKDITEERPDYYYARREVPRMEAELDATRQELWDQAKQLAECERHGRWYRNVGPFTCDYCDYADICLQGVTVNGDTAPAGYRFVEDKHPELTEVTVNGESP